MKKLLILISFLLSTLIFAKSVTLTSISPIRNSVKVHLPKGFNKKAKWPLIISLHGFGGSSKIQDFYVRLNKYQNKFGYVFASPDGLKNSKGKGFWNASNFCCDFEKSNVDDVAYIENLIQQISNSKMIGRIDTSKIFLIGYSNGAFLASKIACNSSIKVAGVVSISGTSDLRDQNGDLVEITDLNCRHNRAIPTLHVHGTSDKTILYNGKDNGVTGHVGAIDHLNRWAIQNRCEGKLVKKGNSFNSSNFLRGKDTEHFVINDCLAPVEHYRVNDGAHFGVFKKSFTKRLLNFLFR